MIVGAAVAIPVTLQMVSSASGDSALIMAQTFLESGRNRAVAERRNVELVFISPNRMQLVRIEVPSGVRTTVGDVDARRQRRVRPARRACPTRRTRSAPSAAISFTGTAPVMFTSDGSLIDSAGDVTNGTIFIARPGVARHRPGHHDLRRHRHGALWKWRGSEWQQ